MDATVPFACERLDGLLDLSRVVNEHHARLKSERLRGGLERRKVVGK